MIIQLQWMTCKYISAFCTVSKCRGWLERKIMRPLLVSMTKFDRFRNPPQYSDRISNLQTFLTNHLETFTREEVQVIHPGSPIIDIMHLDQRLPQLL